ISTAWARGRSTRPTSSTRSSTTASRHPARTENGPRGPFSFARRDSGYFIPAIHLASTFLSSSLAFTEPCFFLSFRAAKMPSSPLAAASFNEGPIFLAPLTLWQVRQPDFLARSSEACEVTETASPRTAIIKYAVLFICLCLLWSLWLGRR